MVYFGDPCACISNPIFPQFLKTKTRSIDMDTRYCTGKRVELGLFIHCSPCTVIHVPFTSLPVVTTYVHAGIDRQVCAVLYHKRYECFLGIGTRDSGSSPIHTKIGIFYVPPLLWNKLGPLLGELPLSPSKLQILIRLQNALRVTRGFWEIVLQCSFSCAS